MTCILATIMLSLGLFLAVAFVSGNNLSACVGTAIGGRVINPRTGMALGAAGFVVGVMGQGTAMTHTVNAILPLSDTLIISKALFVIVFIFLLANIVRIPLPLTMSLVGLLVGVATAHHLPMQVDFLVTVIAVWFVAPALALVLAFYSVRLLDRIRPMDFWRRIAVYKVSPSCFRVLELLCSRCKYAWTASSYEWIQLLDHRRRNLRNFGRFLFPQRGTNQTTRAGSFFSQIFECSRSTYYIHTFG